MNERGVNNGLSVTGLDAVSTCCLSLGCLDLQWENKPIAPNGKGLSWALNYFCNGKVRDLCDSPSLEHDSCPGGDILLRRIWLTAIVRIAENHVSPSL